MSFIYHSSSVINLRNSLKEKEKKNNNNNKQTNKTASHNTKFCLDFPLLREFKYVERVSVRVDVGWHFELITITIKFAIDSNAEMVNSYPVRIQ